MKEKSRKKQQTLIFNQLENLNIMDLDIFVQVYDFFKLYLKRNQLLKYLELLVANYYDYQFAFLGEGPT